MINHRKYNRTYRTIKDRVYKLVWLSDLLAVRVILAISALIYGIAVCHNPDTTLVANMLNILPANTWSGLFIVQGLVMSWSLLCDKRPGITLWVDALLGCILWTSSTIASLLWQFPNQLTLETLLEYYKLPPSMVPNIGITIASWWVLIRHYTTGGKDERI